MTVLWIKHPTIMQFQCDTAARIPIYQQLVDQVREQVARGKLQPGDRLPSVRQLSRELVVNPNTIAKAYSELEHGGVILARQGLGVFVAKPQAASEARLERVGALVDRVLVEAVHLGCSGEEVAKVFNERVADFQFRATG